MKRTKIITSVLIIMCIFISFCNYAMASEGYVGVKENDVFIWEHTYVEDVMDNYIEDLEDYLNKYNIYGESIAESSIEVFNGTDIRGQILIGDGEGYIFKILVSADKNLTIYVNNTIYKNIELTVYDQDGFELGYILNGTDYIKGTVHTPTSGYYYILLELNDNGPAYYDMKINVTEWIGDYYEPNNDFSEAVIVDYCFEDEDLECSNPNPDYFVFNGNNSYYYIIEIFFENSTGNLDLFLFNDTKEEGLIGESREITDSEFIYYEADFDEKLYIKINNTNDWSTYGNHTYELRISRSGICVFTGGRIDLGYHFEIEDTSDIEGTKVVVKNVKEEKNDCVEVKISEYESKDITDEDKWKSEDDYIVEIYDPNTDKCYKEWSMDYFIPKGLDWDKLAVEIEEDIEDTHKKCEIIVDVNFLGNGLTIIYDFEIDDVENIEYYYEYDINGVRALLIYKYDGKEFLRITLRGYIPLYIIVLSIGGAIIGVIAITIIIIRKRK